MVKTNKQKILTMIAEINKKQGAGSMYTIGDETGLKIPRWKTGIKELDGIIGGGMPEGRTIEIYGAEGAGKTSLVYHLCSLHDLALDLCAEGTFDHTRAKMFGNRQEQLYIYRGATGEDNMNKAIAMARNGMPLIAIDSVPSLIPQDDMDKVMKSANRGTVEELRIGGTARLMEKYIPVLENIIEHTGTTVVFVNQLRDKLDAAMFGEKTRTPGGHRLLHSYSIRIQVARRAWIEIPNYNPRNSADKEKIGMIMKCKVTKSKVCNPLGECEIPLFFDRGFVEAERKDSVRKEIMEQKKEYYKELKKERKDEEWDEWDEVEMDV